MPIHWKVPAHAACRLVYQPPHVEVGMRPYMVLIHVNAAGVHVLFGMAVHSIHNITHIRSHAAGGGVLCNYGPLFLHCVHGLIPKWFASLVAVRLSMLSTCALH
jgi:hypothetical protein